MPAPWTPIGWNQKLLNPAAGDTFEITRYDDRRRSLVIQTPGNIQIAFESPNVPTYLWQFPVAGAQPLILTWELHGPLVWMPWQGFAGSAVTVVVFELLGMEVRDAADRISESLAGLRSFSPSSRVGDGNNRGLNPTAAESATPRGPFFRATGESVLSRIDRGRGPRRWRIHPLPYIDSDTLDGR